MLAALPRNPFEVVVAAKDQYAKPIRRNRRRDVPEVAGWDRSKNPRATT